MKVAPSLSHEDATFISYTPILSPILLCYQTISAINLSQLGFLNLTC